MPQLATRIAVRYINRIPIPRDLEDVKAFLSTPPQLPAEIPDLITAFVYRITVSAIELDAFAHIIEAVEGGEGKRSLLLDIDAFRPVSLLPDDAEVAASFAPLRELKNRMFFGLLTEEAVRRFE
jgi:uncharacterized protein (TIGR04255 family)